MADLEFEGTRIHFVREGEGPPVVFLHNGGASHRIWEPQMASLAAAHTVVAFDFPGFGESEPPRRDYTLGYCVDLLERLVQAQNLNDVTLVGNCMGGATALEYTARHPQDVHCVVAINVLTERTVAAGILGPVVALRPRASSIRRTVSAALSHMPVPSFLARHYVRIQIADASQVDPSILEHLASRWRDPGNSVALNRLRIDTFAAPDRQPDWPPIHVLWGTRNRILPAHTAQEVCRTVAADRLIEIEGAGHLPMLERPARVIAAIEDAIVSAASSAPF